MSEGIRGESLLQSALGRNPSDCSDEQLAKFQSSVMAASATLANLWSYMETQSFSGRPREMLPAGDVVHVMKAFWH